MSAPLPVKSRVRGGEAGRTVSITAPTGSVRGRFAPLSVAARPRNPERTGAQRTAAARNPASNTYAQVSGIDSEGERAVKPSAQPRLVRTQHLPPTAKTAR